MRKIGENSTFYIFLLTNSKICAKIIVQYYENVDEEGFFRKKRSQRAAVGGRQQRSENSTPPLSTPNKRRELPLQST